MNKPYHTGFFFKTWDRLFGSLHPEGVEKSAMRSIERGERTREAWLAVEKPDYRALLAPSIWLPRSVTVSLTKEGAETLRRNSSSNSLHDVIEAPPRRSPRKANKRTFLDPSVPAGGAAAWKED